MPLFTSPRDTGLLKGLNKEIVQRVISTEVALMKVSIEHTESNIYGESSQKVLTDPVRVYAIITPGDKEAESVNTVISYNKSFKFGFLKQELEEKGLTIDAGDYVYYDDKYFEIDVVSESQYWGGRNPNTAIGTIENGWSLYGYDYAINVEAHLTNESLFMLRNGSIELIKG